MVSQSTTIIQQPGSPSDRSLQVNRWFLKPIGAWPSSLSTSRLERLASVMLIILCYCCILFTVIPCMLHICLEDVEIGKKLRAFGPLIHWFMGGVNYTALLVRGNEIRDCVQHLRSDWQIVTKVQHRSVMTRYANFGRFASVFCAVFMQGGVLSYCFVTALSTRPVVIGNETRIVHVLPCEFYQKLVNPDESPANEIILVSQFLSAFVVNSSAVGAFSLAAALAAHACGQLNILMTQITEMVNRPRDHDTNILITETGAIVENHLRILSFISQIEAVMNKICFSEMFHSTVCTCMLGYYILTEWDDHDYQNLTTYFMILFSMTFNVFLLCYIGQILTEQCKKVGEVVYMTDWYSLPNRSVLDLGMIIARSSVMIKITASKMFHMSIYTFGQTMKSSFAYFNLLRQTV
ncbi:odorant receptor 10-like isoform X2 [Halictus rubicundus]|uniref:odorant receptor 10-like isoform X2 n=1 Tax=Halictus rubicundus TaxID=77578 RepID=UPI00403747D1